MIVPTGSYLYDQKGYVGISDAPPRSDVQTLGTQNIQKAITDLSRHLLCFLIL